MKEIHLANAISGGNVYQLGTMCIHFLEPGIDIQS